jgi:hypothetical protein
MNKEVFSIEPVKDNSSLVQLTINNRTHICKLVMHNHENTLIFLEPDSKDESVCIVQIVMYKCASYGIITYNPKLGILPFLIDGVLMCKAITEYMPSNKDILVNVSGEDYDYREQEHKANKINVVELPTTNGGYYTIRKPLYNTLYDDIQNEPLETAEIHRMTTEGSVTISMRKKEIRFITKNVIVNIDAFLRAKKVTKVCK